MRKHEVTNLGVSSSSRNVIGYRFSTTKEEAIGAFVLQTQAKYPQYDLGEVVVVEIPEDQLVHHVEAEHPPVAAMDNAIIDKARNLLLLLKGNMLPAPHTPEYVNYSSAVNELEIFMCRKFPGLKDTIHEIMRKGFAK